MKVAIDEKTLKAFNRGDAHAFKAIHAYFYTPLCYFAYKLTDNQAEAQDIVNETFLKLFQRYQYFESYVNIRAFLYITARNASYNMLKQSKRQIARHQEFTVMMEQLENEDYLENELVEGEVMREIYLAIEKLPEGCKKVFKMIYYEGRQHADIAALLNISVSTVRTQRRRAITLLRGMLSDRGYTILIGLLFSDLLRQPDKFPFS